MTKRNAMRHMVRDGVILTSWQILASTPFALRPILKAHGWVGGAWLTGVIVVFAASGAVGGVVFSLLSPAAPGRSARYYLRWVVAAEVSAVTWVVLLGSMLVAFRPPSAGSPRIVEDWVGNLMVLAAILLGAGVGGLAYGRTFRDQ
jgi:hypothetical protein